MEKTDSKIYRVGVGWSDGWSALALPENEKQIGFGESGREFRVIVWADEENVAYYTEIFAQLYGDKAVVVKGHPFTTLSMVV